VVVPGREDGLEEDDGVDGALDGDDVEEHWGRGMEGGRVGDDEEEDLGPLPPRRYQRKTGSGGHQRDDSSLTMAVTQAQGRVASPLGRPSRDNLSSDASHDSNPRSGGSWALGGSQVQRRVTSALGRRYRDNLSSEASRNSDLRNKRLRVESSHTAEIPSSPPITPSSLSPNSDAPSGASGKRLPRKYLTREFVPRHNLMVFDLTKRFLEAEVLACQPWPNTSAIETLIRRSWSKALQIREEERREVYPGSGHAAKKAPPTKSPDEVTLDIVSMPERSGLKKTGWLMFPAQTPRNSIPWVFGGGRAQNGAGMVPFANGRCGGVPFKGSRAP
jgi:hypothetical protein